MELQTHFAPAERLSSEEVGRQAETLRREQMLSAALEAIPNVLIVLNPQRQIVFYNSRLPLLLGSASGEQLIGIRPGEALGCIHSHEMDAGCGTSESCRVCGAVIAVLSSMQTQKAVTQECQINVSAGQEINALDLRVTATPFSYENQHYTIVTVFDISDEKRRQVLERIFFHDILNTASALQSCVETIPSICDNTSDSDVLAYIPILSRQIIDGVQSQRQLLQAERGELDIFYDHVSPFDLLREAIAQTRQFAVDDNIGIEIDKHSPEAVLVIDTTIALRVLVNMLKNAFEASMPGETVSAGYQLTGEDRVRFWVRNPAVIPRGVQLQIFNRSFSTKGADRGIGTYSMKLLTERYLKGEIGFSSEEGEGTTFYAELPLVHPSADEANHTPIAVI